MKISGFKAYQYYQATKLHFTTDSYNVFETKGRVKGSQSAFDRRKDKYVFEKIAKKFNKDKDIIQFYVANFAYDNNQFLYSLDKSNESYKKWRRIKESITKVFVDDLAKILKIIEDNDENSLDDLTKTRQYENPILLQLYLEKEINIETLRIIDDLYPYLNKWEEKESLARIWENDIRIIKKLNGFVIYNQEKMQKVWNTFVDELKR